MAHVTVLTDEEALAARAAERVTSIVEASIALHDGVRICLAGGRTPRRLYELLADVARPWRARIDWTRVHMFWNDERHVAPDHTDSNFGMAFHALLAHVPIPSAQIHRIRGELPDAAAAARQYDAELRGATRHAALFDVMLLGVGEDAHIASIFPGSALSRGANAPGLTPRDPLVAAVYVDHLRSWRITLTPPALLDARAIVVLVSGANKAPAVRAALDETDDTVRWPAQLLRGAGDRVEWLIDSAAAGRRDAPPS